MRTIGNILWAIFGGFIQFLLWGVTGLLLCITLIGIPFGLQCFKIAGFVLWPFGRDVIYGGSAPSFLMNILWILFCGWELAVSAIVLGLLYCITLILIPFGIQSFKFAKLALMPFGTRIVRV
ncbi:MAG: hypothetical protein A2Y17_00225 [Clostridiales bacterium GWF2_38_85]|nr:MAG: hypothetical protein A2Y17_00225 [Clostridiales bacterium GWF2_38_85]HBL83886.1 YccF domain-containing protein [Clostridiales bacterium]